MKKIILLLATFIISANAINCLEGIMNLYLTQDYSMITHSYFSPGQEAYDSTGKLKFREINYWNNGSLDSIYIFDDGYKGIHDEFTDPVTATISYTENRNVGIYSNVSSTSTQYHVATFFQDSVHIDEWLYENTETRGDKPTYTVDIYIKADTIFETDTWNNGNADTSESFIYTMDTQSQKCYSFPNKEDTLSVLPSKGDTIVLLSEDGDKFYYFLLPINSNDNTSITRKFHPATINRQYHYFDLMGRPAKGKNIIKVVK